jgi:hypothetical protein
MPPWDELCTLDQVDYILNRADDAVYQEKQDALKALEDATLQEMELVYDQVKMQGRSAVEDWKRFFSGYPRVARMLKEIEARAQTQAQEIGLDFSRKEAAATLGLQPAILQMGLADAQADMLGYTDPNAARQAFERTFDQYEQILRGAERQLTHPTGSASVDLGSEADNIYFGAVLGWMGIWSTAMADPTGYGNVFFDQSPPDVSPDELEPETVIEIPLEGADVEYNLTTGEIKVKVGEGLMIAGTWSPKEGFGMEFGAGIDLAEMGLGLVKQASFIKFGSDGSVSIVSESAGGDIALQQVTITNPIQAATNEPVGAIDWP